MFCDCCMVQLLYVQPYTHEVVARTLWRGGFCGGYGGFDTPRNASVCNGLRGVGLSPFAFQYWNVYIDNHARQQAKQAKRFKALNKRFRLYLLSIESLKIE